MPGPLEVLHAFASGLDPREVLRNTANTAGTVLEQFDRPRAAIQASAVRAEDAGSFFDAVFRGLLGLGEGFANPEQFPAPNLAAALLTDPTNFIPLGGIGALRRADDLAPVARQLLTRARSLGLDDAEIAAPVRNAVLGLLRSVGDSPSALQELDTSLSNMIRKVQRRGGERELSLLEPLRHEVRRLPEFQEARQLASDSRRAKDVTGALTDLQDTEARLREVRGLLAEANDMSREFDAESWVQQARSLINELGTNADELSNRDLQPELEDLLNSLEGEREFFLQTWLSARSRVGSLPGDQGVQHRTPGSFDFNQTLRDVLSPPDDPRDILRQLLGE